MYSSLYSNIWGVPSSTITGTDADGNLTINVSSVELNTNHQSIGPGENPSDFQSQLIIELEKRGKSAPSMEKRTELIQHEHSLGHFGREAIFKKLWSNNIWWPKFEVIFKMSLTIAMLAIDS